MCRILLEIALFDVRHVSKQVQHVQLYVLRYPTEQFSVVTRHIERLVACSYDGLFSLLLWTAFPLTPTPYTTSVERGMSYSSFTELQNLRPTL